MIAQITGRIIAAPEGAVVIDAGGIGYLVHVTKAASRPQSDKQVTLFTHLAVREHALDLYGFWDSEELLWFEHLLTLPKIGPKSALQILGAADVTLIKHAVARNEPDYLAKMSGVGKKTAEKIVAGLKDTLGEWVETEEPHNPEATDVIDALVALGYARKDARAAVKALPPELSGTSKRVAEALKVLSG